MAAATIETYLADLARVIPAIDGAQLDAVAGVLLQAWRVGSTVYTLGNGGSASLASHMACDLGKNTSPDLGTGPTGPAGRRLRVVSLAENTALVTALGNDITYDDVYVEQLKNLLVPGDVVIAVSGSGASPNVVRALAYARRSGAVTVGLTGARASAAAMLALCDHALVAPVEVMEQIEDLHVIFNHVLAVYLRELVRGECVGA